MGETLHAILESRQVGETIFHKFSEWNFGKDYELMGFIGKFSKDGWPAESLVEQCEETERVAERQLEACKQNTKNARQYMETLSIKAAKEKL